MTTSGIRGSNDLKTVGAALKAAGNRGLKNETAKAIRKVGAEVVQDVKAGGLATIPSRGGLAKRIAGSGIGVRTRWTGRGAGVVIAKTNKLGKITGFLIDDYGSFRHPVFADGTKTRKEWLWVQQSASLGQGWFKEEIAKRAPEFREGIEKVLEETAEKIAGSV